jgi:hypothetical protein
LSFFFGFIFLFYHVTVSGIGFLGCSIGAMRSAIVTKDSAIGATDCAIGATDSYIGATDCAIGATGPAIGLMDSAIGATGMPIVMVYAHKLMVVGKLHVF